MSAEHAARAVVVTGDVTMDWNVLRSRHSDPPSATWTARDLARASCQRGGAALLAELVAETARRLGTSGVDVALRGPTLPRGRLSPGDERYHHSYALWGRTGGAWRVEEFLGLDRGPADTPPEWMKSDGDASAANLVILDDAGLGFRDYPELWPQALGATARPWVLLKMARPVATGPLWERLQGLADRMIVVMTIDDLRLTDVQISRELSWERTAQDLVWELVHNPNVNALSRCAHVVVSFDTAGAIVLSAGASGPRGELVFDPPVIEGSWAQQHPGGMIGYTSCLVAALAREVLLSSEAPDVSSGVRRGLAAMRALHVGGYEERGTPPRVHLAFPAARVADSLASQDHDGFAVAPIRAPEPGGGGFWTILEDGYTGGLEPLAQRIALEGPERVLDGVPIGRFGKLLTIDRREIEGYRSVRTLILEYARQRRPERPLSIAVFGPPGAGKSFGVAQVAASVLPDRAKKLTFNLSQLDGPADLLAALHQVRDVSLQGFLPLVFWDEFDASLGGEPLGWLRHFLAPMQDGEFQEGQVIHPIGPAIFVFAGGTKERMEAFAGQTGDAFRRVKGPDFVSRLKGYVDVLGPNPRGGNSTDDPYFVVRRAILLRAIQERATPGLFRSNGKAKVLDIDPGVLRAFLLTRTFRHGARSLESIVAMSLLSGKQRFERSCLPAEPQLDLHVDARDFLALVHRLDLEGELLERLAEAAHVVFCAGLLDEGYAWGEPDDTYLAGHDALAPFAGSRGGRPHPSLVSYAALPEIQREQNRALVRDIPNKLAAAGYVMRPARGGDPAASLTPNEVETLAEQEHERWMRLKLEAGWRYGPVRDDAAKRHPSLLLWTKLSAGEGTERYGAFAEAIGADELPEEEREKDREMIRGIPRMLAAAGYTIEKIAGESPAPDRGNG